LSLIQWDSVTLFESYQTSTARKTIGQISSPKKGKFSHSNDPYPIEDATDSIVAEKEHEKPFNLIKKGE